MLGSHFQISPIYYYLDISSRYCYLDIPSVVNIGHMLGLDQEREELGRKHVSYRYGDPSFKYVCLFVCMYFYSIVNR